MALVHPLVPLVSAVDLEVVPLAPRLLPGLAVLDNVPDRWASYHRQHEAGSRWSLVALAGGRPAGHGSLLWPNAERGHEGRPEITDIIVARGCRRRGIGALLLRELESWATAAGHHSLAMKIPLGAEFSAMPRLAVKQGFVPDIPAVSLEGRPVATGAYVQIDKALVLQLVKSL